MFIAKIVSTRTDCTEAAASSRQGIITCSSPSIIIHRSYPSVLSSSAGLSAHSRGAIMPNPTEIFERGITGFGITVITMLRLGCLKS